MRKLKIALVVLGVALLVGAILFWRMWQLPPPQIAAAEGQPAPAFTLPDQHGNEVSLAELRGRRVVLVFYRGHW